MDCVEHLMIKVSISFETNPVKKIERKKLKLAKIKSDAPI